MWSHTELQFDTLHVFFLNIRLHTTILEPVTLFSNLLMSWPDMTVTSLENVVFWKYYGNHKTIT